MSKGSSRSQGSSNRVVYGVTVGASAFSLLRGQLRWLGDQGWDVTLVTTPDDAALAAVVREGVKFCALPMSRGITPLADGIALARWLRLLRRIRPVVVNVSTPKAGLLGGIAAWLQRVPRRVYVVRGLRVEGVIGALHAVLWLAEWVTMRVATDVIFVSPSLAAEATRRRLLSRSKSWVIGAGSSNGVDVRAVAERAATVDREHLRTSLNLSTDDFVVGFIGRIAKDKGLETLARAFGDERLDSNARLLCVGATEDEELAGSLGALGSKARFVPWTEDVWGVLPAIDVLCLPTRREGFPNVVLEAAAAEIPAITTRATGAVDSVIDEKTGFLIDVDDSEALVMKLNVWANSPDELERLGSEAKQRVLREFQPEMIWLGVSELLSGERDPFHARRVAYTRTSGDAR